MNPDGCGSDWIWIWTLLFLVRMDPLVAEFGMDCGNRRLVSGRGRWWSVPDTSLDFNLNNLDPQWFIFQLSATQIVGKREGYSTARKSNQLEKKLLEMWKLEAIVNKKRLNCWWWRVCIVVALHEPTFNAVSLPCILSNHLTTISMHPPSS